MISPIRRCKKKSTFIGESLLLDKTSEIIELIDQIPQKDFNDREQNLLEFLKSLDFNKGGRNKSRRSKKKLVQRMKDSDYNAKFKSNIIQ